MTKFELRHEQTYQFVKHYLSAIDSPRSLAVWLLFSYKEHDQLLALECNPFDYLRSEDFRNAFLATKFLSKATFLSTTVDKKTVAMEKFHEAENACREINKKGFEPCLENARFEWVHNATIRKIESILGDFSAVEIFDNANWGPGVTTLIKGCDTSSVNKFRCENGTTHLLHDLMGGLYASAYPTWDLTKVKFQVGNKVITVPKNSKTDRTIAVEPGLNLWFQKGIGTMIRRRLNRVGIDLNSQRRNQQLARVASKFGHLATVDFSSASDTISRATVEALIPRQWHLLLNLCRSHQGLIGKSQIEYEKFSSMGNGFTFELESLIFFAIAFACVSYVDANVMDISVYGDDVIIPVSAYSLYAEVCSHYGFTVNKQKSYSFGYFRESCGEYYYNGTDCKPYFLKEALSDNVSIMKAANSVRRRAHHSIGNFHYCEARFRPVFYALMSSVPKSLRFRISDRYGDGGFIANFDEACPSRAKKGIEGFLCKHYIFVPLGYESDDHAVLLARLRSRSVDMSYGNTINYRARVKKMVKRLHVPRWVDLGPWI